MPKQPSIDPHLYQQMDRKKTEELLTMWRENDRSAWSDEAFAAMHAILLQRLGHIPEPGAPSVNDVIESEREQPEFASEKLILIATWANRLAWLILAISVLMFFFRIIQDFGQSLPGIPGHGFVLVRLELWVTYLYSLCVGAFYFVLLEAVSEGAYFLISRLQE